MDGIHNSQTKEELIYRLEHLALRLGCHADLIYGKVVDLQRVVMEIDPTNKVLENDREKYFLKETE